MSPGFIRLAIAGNRRALGRLAAIFAGIALGTAMILLLSGAYFRLSARENRSAWIKPVGTIVESGSIADGSVAVFDALQDWYRGVPITRIDLYAPPNAPLTLPGIPTWPAAGTYYASPALAQLIANTPPDQLGDRFGTPAGLIDVTTLKGPDVLAIVTGQSLDSISGRSGLIETATARGSADGQSTAYQAVAAIGAIGMLSPVLLFVLIATKLGAASRRESFSALRLIGATPRQVALVAGAETFMVSLAGALAGIVLAALLRPLAAMFPINGAAFFAADLDPGPMLTCLIATGIVVAATLTSIVAIRLSGIGPLGGSRSMAERPARWTRILPLLLGLGMIVAASPQAGLVPPVAIAFLLLGGFAIVAAGIVAIGPWLTAWCGRIVATLSRSAAGMIVANRIAQAPVATFRAVSGLVIAVFMVTVFSAASSSVASRITVDGDSDALVTVLAPGATIPASLPGAVISPLPGTPARFIATAENSGEALERLRTAIQTTTLWSSLPATRSETNLLGVNRILSELSVVAYTGAFITIIIAGCSLSLATLGSILDRRRIFGLLRLIGTPAKMLDRVVFLEAAVPLAAVLALSAGAGYLTADLILRVLDDSLRIGAPDLRYFAILALGLGVALVILQVARQAAHRIPDDATRFE